MRSLRPKVVVAMSLLVASASPGHAQFGIESIFKDINELAFFVSCWTTSSDAIDRTEGCPRGNSDFGIEATYHVTRISLRRGTRIDTTMVFREAVVRGSDTTKTYDVRMSAEPVGPSFAIDFALGYSQFTGFRSADPGLDLRGAVREIPSVTLYATYSRSPRSRLLPYVGVRTGLIQLRDVQAIALAANPDSSVTYGGEAQAFQLGLIGGVGFNWQRATFFAEGALMRREFDSVRWVSSGSRLPAVIPRNLDFSGFSGSAGLQFRIR